MPPPGVATRRTTGKRQAATRASGEDEVSLEEHLRRFRAAFACAPAASGDGPSRKRARIVGTATALEKAYFRSTNLVDASSVRSRATCERALAMLGRKWKASRDYKYAGEQFKSLRQDLQVQGISDELAVRVFEAHARIAIEMGDMSELIVCQTRLRELYGQNPTSPNRDEFCCYRILHAAAVDDTTAVLSEQAAARSSGSLDAKDGAVALALDVAYAYRSRDYVRFFRMLRRLPRLAGILAHSLRWRMRFQALRRIMSGFGRRRYPLESLVRVLGFGSLDACVRWLKMCGATCDGGSLLCQPSAKLRAPKVRRVASGGASEGVTHGSLF